MSTLAFWMPWIVAFIFTLALSSFVSGGAYWLARRTSNVVRVVKGFSFVLILFAWLSLLGVVPTSHLPGIVLFLVLVITGASGLQALIERSLTGEPLAIKPHFARALFTYLSTASLLFIIVRVLAVTLAGKTLFPTTFSLPLEVLRLSNWLYRLTMGSSSAPVWMLCLSTAFCGLLVGCLFSPLSISFYRLFFQNMWMPDTQHSIEQAKPSRGEENKN